MEHHDQPFTPEHVDEQIEQHIYNSHMPKSQFFSEMQQVTQRIRTEHELSIQRVEQRLMKFAGSRTEHTTTAPFQNQSQFLPSQHTFIQERLLRMETKQTSKLA